MSPTSKPWVGHQILPLVVVDDAKNVLPVIEALAHGGLSVIEIALRTPAALHAIEMAANHGNVTVAAGTVTSADHVKHAIDAGASFGLAPSSSLSVMEACQAANWPFIPGIATVSEAHSARDKGFEFQKAYPADLLGAEKFARSIHHTLPEIMLLPSGGVTQSTMEAYLREPNVFGVSGSWIAPRDLIANGDFAEISRRAREASETVKSIG